MTEKSDRLTKNAASENRKEKSIKKEKKGLTKVVIRKLPPTMTEEEFLKQIEPLPDHESYYFVEADWSLGREATCRAYINFKNHDDIFLFKDRFDGYVFVDIKGNEYPAVVEFAPFQNFLKNKCRKNDPKCNTIENDPCYKEFLKKIENDENEVVKNDLNLDINSLSKYDKQIKSTPLLEYLANKKQERRDEKKRKIELKKRQRDEERRKKKIQVEKSIPPAIEEESKEKINKRKDKFEKETSIERDYQLKREQKRKERNRELPRDRGRERHFTVTKCEKKEDSNLSKTSKNDKKTNEKSIEDKQKNDGNMNDKKIISSEKSLKTSNSQNDLVKQSETSKQVEIKNKSEITKQDETITKKFDTKKSPTEQKNVAQKQDETMIMKSTSSKDDNTIFKIDNIDTKAKTSSESIKVIENSLKSSESNSDSKNTERRGNEDKPLRRVRNKDRPSIEIYQPGKKRLSTKQVVNSDSKDNQVSDVENTKKDDNNQQNAVTKKKVKRYSEHRSYRLKEREERLNKDSNE